MTGKSPYLFVYGTLLNNTNEFAVYLKNNSTFYKKAKFRGKLYDIGQYPGAIFQPDNDGFVYGSIFVMKDADDTLKILDDYEGYGYDHPQPNEFVRELIEVETDDKSVECWVYLYNWPVEGLSLIVSGKYL
jgi:gamma-glutamylcyclotransferase (GGCT)/AIG2-like uncharacterized protein YtfP